MTTFEISGNRRTLREGECPFCRRLLPLTFHHLIPKKMHRRRRFQKAFSVSELNAGLFICRACHDGIHRRYSELELAMRFRTPEALAADPDLDRHFRWVARQRRQSG